jgi:hypothetical protein
MFGCKDKVGYQDEMELFQVLLRDMRNSHFIKAIFSIYMGCLCPAKEVDELVLIHGHESSLSSCRSLRHRAQPGEGLQRC